MESPDVSGKHPFGVTATPKMTADQSGLDGSVKMKGPSSTAQMKFASVRRLPAFIAAKVARQDFAAVSSAMSLIPLKFRNKSEEARFFGHLLAASDIRTKLATYLAAFMFIGFWIVTGIATGMKVYPYGDAFLNIVLFHVALVGVFVALGLFRYLTKSNWFRQRIDIWLYVACLLMILFPQIWIIVVTGQFPSETPVDVINIQEFKLWLAPFTLGIYLWNAVIINLFLQTRTRYSFLPQLMMLLVLLAFDMAQAIIFTEKQLSDDVEVYHEDRFAILVALLECWSLLLVFLMCHFGRWNLELQERIEFWKLMKSNDQLRELRDATVKKQKKSGSTAVEDLMDIIMRAVSRVQESEVTTGNKLLVESTEILRQIQNVLTNTDNLYAVRIQADRKQSNATGDADGADMEAQFYEIYANKKTHTNKQPREKASKRLQSSSLDKDMTPRAESLHLAKVQNLAPQPIGSAEFRRGVGRDWNCSVLKAAAEYPNILVEVGALLLEPRAADIGASPITIRNYVYRLERLYRPNPYHNASHGAMVAHSMCCLLRMLDISESDDFSPIDAVSVVVAALGHDVGHPGRNNQFYVNTFQKMALLWNDKAVLENFHSALVFKSLEPKTCNILGGLEPDAIRGVRKKIIDLILATDMSQHFESVSKFRLRRQAAGFDFLNDLEDMWLVIRMCIKCADLSHALVDWPQHQEWSLRVGEEFYQQGEEEVSLGLPKSPLCDREQHHDFPKSQKGFIEFVVQPLFTQLEEMDPGDRVADMCLKHLTYNKYKWEEMARDKKTLPVPPSISSQRTDSSSSRLLVMHLLVPKGFHLTNKAVKEQQPFERKEAVKDAAKQWYAEEEDWSEEEYQSEEEEAAEEEEEEEVVEEEVNEEEEEEETDQSITSHPERSSTLATARFGGDSDIDQDQPFPESEEGDETPGEDAQQVAQWWDEEEEEEEEGEEEEEEEEEEESQDIRQDIHEEETRDNSLQKSLSSTDDERLQRTDTQFKAAIECRVIDNG